VGKRKKPSTQYHMQVNQLILAGWKMKNHKARCFNTRGAILARDGSQKFVAWNGNVSDVQEAMT